MMNTGQMLMVLGAVILFSLLLPSINGTILYNDKSMTTTKVQVNAMAIAQKYLTEAHTKLYDKLMYSPPDSIDSTMFTPTDSLGADPGETNPSQYNDVDDYNSLSIDDSTTMPTVKFHVTGDVIYVVGASPTQQSQVQTYVKRVRITVTSTFLISPANGSPAPIYFERLYGYFGQ